jgi:hypothetical protein
MMPQPAAHSTQTRLSRGLSWRHSAGGGHRSAQRVVHSNRPAERSPAGSRSLTFLAQPHMHASSCGMCVGHVAELEGVDEEDLGIVADEFGGGESGAGGRAWVGQVPTSICV